MKIGFLMYNDSAYTSNIKPKECNIITAYVAYGH